MFAGEKRLAAAKAGREFAIRKIAEGEAHRRQALLDGDDAMAQAADLVLGALRLELRRREDEIELLPSLISREEQESRLPPDPVAARALLADKERRYRALSARPLCDRSASDQQEIDAYPIASGQLQQHIARLERMA
jgi:hypothetical protein